MLKIKISSVIIASLFAASAWCVPPGTITSTFFGADDYEFGGEPVYAADGSLWMLVSTGSIDLPVPNVPLIEYGSKGNGDILIVRLSPDTKQLEEIIRIGGTGADAGLALHVGDDGSIIVAGETRSPDFPVVAAWQDTYAGGGPNFGGDGFLFKLAPDRSLVFSTYFGGGEPPVDYDGFEFITELAVQPNGEIVAIGVTDAADFPSTFITGGRACVSGLLEPSQVGFMNDGFIARFNSDGQLLTATCIGGSNRTNFYGLNEAPNGDWQIVGDTRALDFPMVNPIQGVNGSALGRPDGLMLRVAPDFSGITFSTYLGGALNDYTTISVIGPDGTVYLVGRTTSEDYPTTPGVYQSQRPLNNFSSRTDTVITAISADLSGLVFSTYLGGLESDSGSSLFLDAQGRIWVGGRTYSPDYPMVDSLVDSVQEQDITLTILSADGAEVLFSTVYGGSGIENLARILFSQSGEVTVVGRTESADFPILDAFQSQFAGVSDVFVTRLDIDKDGDDVFSGSDNCLNASNADQTDSDADGYGNACDADFNNDCTVNVQDLGLLRAGFFGSDPLLDLNSDGVVNVEDLGILRTLFFATPGPSGVSALCDGVQ